MWVSSGKAGNIAKSIPEQKTITDSSFRLTKEAFKARNELSEWRPHKTFLFPLLFRLQMKLAQLMVLWDILREKLRFFWILTRTWPYCAFSEHEGTFHFELQRRKCKFCPFFLRIASIPSCSDETGWKGLIIKRQIVPKSGPWISRL